MADVLNLQLGSIKLGKDTWSIAATSLNGSPVGASVSVAADKGLSQALNGYGTLKLDADGETLTLQGGSKLTGEVNIVETDANISLSAVAFGAAVSVDLKQADHQALKTVVGSSSADSISVAGFTSEEFVLNAGAGNDIVVAEDVAGKVDAGAGNDVVSVKSTVGEVVLGGGKDTLAFADDATVKVSDYNFKDDVIVLADAVLDKTGKLFSGSKEVTGFTAENGVFYVKTVADAAPTTVLATAEEDARKVTINANVSDVKKENVVIIDAQAADSANITLGKASVVAVSLNANNDTADVITVGDTKATVNAAVTGFATDDVLNFTGLTFANTSIGFDNGVTLGSGKVSLNLGKAATVAAAAGASEIAKFNLNGTQLFAATAANQVIDLKEETDLSKIWVKGTNTKTDVNGIQVAAAKLVDLRSELIYNINSVKLTEETVAKASVIGTKNDDMGISIDASKTTDGVAVWAGNSSTKKSDMITLGSGEDTLYFGSTDGKDSVSNFSLASDILFLHDADYMTTENGVLKIGKAEMSIGATEATEDIMQVQGAKFAGTVYAAGNFTADGVVNLGDNAGKVNYYAVGKNAQVSVASTEDINYAFLQSYNYAGVANKANIVAGGSVASIDAGNTTSDSKIIIEGVANVTLGAGTNEYWANGVKDAVVELTNSGADKIWFSGSDKKVTVGATSETFSTESDVIALVGSIDDFTAKADTAGTSAVISNANKGALTITNVTSDIALETDNGANKYKLSVADTAEYTTNTNGTNIYLGSQLNASSEVTATTTIVEAEGVNKWGLTSSAIVGKTVKTIDMSGSSADFVLVGSAATANTITGGTGTNWLNGGGASKDVLNGVTGAVDYFYYNNVADGNDTLVNVGTEDTVVLYDVTEAAIDAAKVGADKTVITFKNSDSKLTITGNVDGVIFKLADATYKYDGSIEKAEDRWVKQEV